MPIIILSLLTSGWSWLKGVFTWLVANPWVFAVLVLGFLLVVEHHAVDRYKAQTLKLTANAKQYQADLATLKAVNASQAAALTTQNAAVAQLQQQSATAQQASTTALAKAQSKNVRLMQEKNAIQAALANTPATGCATDTTVLSAKGDL